MIEMARVDLRGLPVWERPGVVFEAFDRLMAGETLTLVTENEPRGLAASLERLRRDEFLLDRRRFGEQEWHVTLKRAHAPAAEVAHGGLLERAAAFRDLPLEARTMLAGKATSHLAHRGATVVGENTAWPYLGVVIEGTLALSTGSDCARQRLFYEVSPGEIFGETEYFDGGLTLGRTIALSKTARYLRIPRDVVAAAGAACPQLVHELAHVSAQRTRFLVEALNAQATQPILARIAAVLVPYAVADRGLAPARPPLPHMTQAQIAAAAGTVKEVAARAIAELETRGLLKREHGHISYLDRQRLLDLTREPA